MLMMLTSAGGWENCLMDVKNDQVASGIFQVF